jgi:hypothetical protein
MAPRAGAEQAWRRARASEERLTRPGFTVAVGQELTVAPGPRFQRESRVLGHWAPGNLDHVSLVGAERFVPTGTPLLRACAIAHAAGGLCIVNHPGPGPMMWEEGLWEAPANRRAIDALEVYNGQALAATGIDFAVRYREATSYRGLGLKIAAVTGADTHGPSSAERARSRLAGLGAAGQLLGMMAPPTAPAGRPELEVATLIAAPEPSLGAIEQAVRARRTVATFRLADLAPDCPGLGEVRPRGDVKLHLGLGRRVDAVTLYREGEPVRSWQDVASVDFAETIDRPAAYVFEVRDGFGRATLSAIWFEPPKSARR